MARPVPPSQPWSSRSCGEERAWCRRYLDPRRPGRISAKGSIGLEEDTHVVLVDNLRRELVDIEGVEHDLDGLAVAVELGRATRKFIRDIELVDVSIKVEIPIAGEVIHRQAIVDDHLEKGKGTGVINADMAVRVGVR